MKTDTLTYSYMALRDKLYRSALRFLKDDEDARDALQDTFFNLWKNGNIESEPEARNKLFVVLRHICIDRLRKPRNVRINDINTEGMKIEDAHFEDMSAYESLLTRGLTGNQRLIYSLVTHEGMEYEDIAERLNMSVESVRMNMCRARKKIRDNFRQLEK